MTALWAGAAALLIGAFAWRFASKRRHLPCPSWLFWILDNPYTAAVAGAEVLLDRAEVSPGMRVLDVGAGPGRVAIPAAHRVGPQGVAVAMDVQDDMLARVRDTAAKQGLKNVITVTGSIENGFPGAADFDRALLITVLGEIPDRAAAMRALYAALRRARDHRSLPRVLTRIKHSTMQAGVKRVIVGRWRSKPPLRRLVTFIGMLCLSLAPLESLMAEAHDDTSTASVVYRADGACTAHEDDTSPPTDGSGRDSHPFHVDHCAHSHLAAIPLRDANGHARLVARRAGIREPFGLHESIVLPPQQRPPIV